MDDKANSRAAPEPARHHGHDTDGDGYSSVPAQTYSPQSVQAPMYEPPPYTYNADESGVAHRDSIGHRTYGGAGRNLMNNSYQNQANVAVLPPIGNPPALQNNPGVKSLADAYLIAVVLGLIGGHHFYLRRYSWAALYFFTFGLLCCGYVIDLFRVPYLVRKYNRELRSERLGVNQHNKDLSDAYVLWFPFGLVGFHHYYLRNYGLGVLFTLTFGIVGIGWLIDGFRMPHLVQSANDRQLVTSKSEARPMKHLWLCYILSFPPLGWLGAHHFYMKRPFYGYAYVLSLGQFGFGWLVDLFRMPILLRRCNDELKLTRKRDVKTVDDCYIMWFPCGLIGFHHYYLGRTGWGVLYTMTLGLFGIGYLFDLFGIPFLVKDSNRNRDEMEEQLVAESHSSQAEHPNHGYNNNNNNNYGTYAPIPSAPVQNHSGYNSDDIMTNPGHSVAYAYPPMNAPPSYSPHNGIDSSDVNGDGCNDFQKLPPPYNE